MHCMCVFPYPKHTYYIKYLQPIVNLIDHRKQAENLFEIAATAINRGSSATGNKR